MSRYNEDYDPYNLDYDYGDDFDDYLYWDYNEDDLLYPGYNDEYYDDAPLTWLDKLQNKWYWLVWRVKHFWDYTLNMHRCPDCKKIYRWGNHNDCVPF